MHQYYHIDYLDINIAPINNKAAYPSSVSSASRKTSASTQLTWTFHGINPYGFHYRLNKGRAQSN
jgi:hypothetical protein